MAQTRLILVGGFLGAGKTTLLARAREHLNQRGLRAGVITNDQGEGLVDTAALQEDAEPVREVAGGCFCCRFGCLVSASDLLVDDFDSDVLLAEPVGSCADISATVLQPLKSYYSGKFTVAPFSVLVDPARLRESLTPDAEAALPNSVSYIFRKQLEEADLIVLNKVDLLDSHEVLELEDILAEEFPDAPVLEMSAIGGRGVEAWLDVVMSARFGGSRIAEVDYDTYADGEAALGWLNASVRLRSDAAVDWKIFCTDLLARVQAELCAMSAPIAHVKLLLDTPGGKLAANLTSSRGQALVRGVVRGSPREAMLVVNARVGTSPDQLRRVVARCLRASAGDTVKARFTELDSFSPRRPAPEHRFDFVVQAEAPQGENGQR